MIYAMLALCAVLEAIVWLWRLRAGVGTSAAQAAISTGLVCATRVMFTVLGVSAVLRDQWLVAGIVYCLTAGAATFAAHGWSVTNQPRRG